MSCLYQNEIVEEVTKFGMSC